MIAELCVCVYVCSAVLASGCLAAVYADPKFIISYINFAK